MAGIVSYGTYIPEYRIRLADIAAAWKKQPEEIVGSLGIIEKAVAGIDEDAVTVAVEAASGALSTFGGSPTDIAALFVGSESHPYAVNPTSTTVGELLGLGHNYLAADTQFACKAATAALQMVCGLVDADQIAHGLVIGADVAQSKPHDVLEYTSAAASGAMIVGKKKVAAEIVAYTSYSSDTPDFWRRDGIRYPSHAGRFTGEPAYFAHVMNAASAIMEKTKLESKDFTWCVFHMPNGKFPQDVAKRLGFTKEQLEPSLTVKMIGNAYAATAFVGLAAVLDCAKPGEKVLFASYGSGAGSDAFVLETTKFLPALQKQRQDGSLLVSQQIQRKRYIEYIDYLKNTKKL